MNRFRYRVFARERTRPEARDALERVRPELAVFLDDPHARVAAEPDGDDAILLTVETLQSEDSCDETLARSLRGLDLRRCKL